MLVAVDAPMVWWGWLEERRLVLVCWMVKTDAVCYQRSLKILLYSLDFLHLSQSVAESTDGGMK